MKDGFSKIDGRQIFWRSKDGAVHAVEGADVHRDVRLLWAVCERDVPANAAYTVMHDAETVTCKRCLGAP